MQHEYYVTAHLGTNFKARNKQKRTEPGSTALPQYNYDNEFTFLNSKVTVT